MTIREALKLTKAIEYPLNGKVVDKTVADALNSNLASGATVTARQSPSAVDLSGVLRVSCAVENFGEPLPKRGVPLPTKNDWLYFRVDDSGGGELVASRPSYLYALSCLVQEDWTNEDVARFRDGRVLTVTFREERTLYDLFLTQHARTIRRFDREEHVRHLARLGFSAIEVNALASPVPIEAGPKYEVYPRFYTYCPALDQFVESRLNRGTYPIDYIRANLTRLKQNAALATKYGLTPGLLCFEPRSVPDHLLDRYPMLRGARVDHPIRSFKPRYNLSIAHPLVREHYTELMLNLMKEVPELGFISVWSNDSGAGFEYTSSLYVGRNGGGYVIREWKSDTEIAEAAAMNLTRFLKLLRDAGRKVNPEFRSIIRLEAFAAERNYIDRDLGDGVDVEVGTLLSKGWDVPYKHPTYDDIPELGGTLYHNRFDRKEGDKIRAYAVNDCRTWVAHSLGTFLNFEPLLGIPFPWLAYEKIRDMADVGVEYAAQFGGASPPSKTPWNINQEVWRAFQFDRSLDLDSTVHRIATRWVGEKGAGVLVRAWKLTDDFIRAWPLPVMIYNTWSVWYRLWTRPIIPNIEAIPEKDREYYEDYLLATPHNRTRVDFRWDVGFDLISRERAWQTLERIDKRGFGGLDEAIRLLDEDWKSSNDGTAAKACFLDQRDRLRALRAWFRTQRNVTAWIAGVHGYLEASDDGMKQQCRTILREMVLQDKQNTKDLLELWETSPVEWMIVSEVGETTLIYDENFGDHLRRKLQLIEGHENDEPYVDPNFQWRVPGLEMQLQSPTFHRSAER
jgi:hypothetical protein